VILGARDDGIVEKDAITGIGIHWKEFMEETRGATEEKGTVGDGVK